MRGKLSTTVVVAMALLALLLPTTAWAGDVFKFKAMIISTAPSAPTITVTNPPPSDLLTLNVGQSYTFAIQVASDTPFVLALALGDEYYPGRGIFFHGNDTAHQTTSATLYLPVTGKESTADLAAADGSQPGVAPAGVVVGVRYAGGTVVSQRYRFGVIVP